MKSKRTKTNKEPETLVYIVKESSELLPFLRQVMSNRSRNSVKSILTRGQVTVDGDVKTHHNYLLEPGQNVTILKNKAAVKKPAFTGMSILHEDKDLIVVSKEAGFLSIATKKEKERTVYHQLTNYVRQENPNQRIFVVHRLDKDTSGVMLVAKNEKTKRALQDNWREAVNERGYVALVEGEVKKDNGIVESWLQETRTHMMYSNATKKNGQHAVTHYQVMWANSDFSLLKVQLETGRKNQIRVHMQDLGHPVVGDKKYGATGDSIGRLGLHANVLTFTHPSTSEELRFESKVPTSFWNKVR